MTDILTIAVHGAEQWTKAGRTRWPKTLDVYWTYHQSYRDRPPYMTYAALKGTP